MPITLNPIGEFLDRKEILDQVPEEIVPLAKHPNPWTGYIVFLDSITIIGVCVFKDIPDSTKCVEIAYYTFLEYKQRGYGTLMARQLVEIAKASNEASYVIAHTLRKENAAARICRRLDFQCEGEVDDPEDGIVWRWRLGV